MSKSQQELVDKTKQAERDFWQTTHNKQVCHDLAKEAEEAIRRNRQREKEKGK